MTPPALAGAGAMDQVPMQRAAAARAAVQIREFSEIFLKLSMFEFELKSCGRHVPYGQNMQAHPAGNPDPLRDVTGPGGIFDFGDELGPHLMHAAKNQWRSEAAVARRRHRERHVVGHQRLQFSP